MPLWFVTGHSLGADSRDVPMRFASLGSEHKHALISQCLAGGAPFDFFFNMFASDG